MVNFRIIRGNSCSTSVGVPPTPKTAHKTPPLCPILRIILIFTVIYLENALISGLFHNRLISSLSRDQLRHMYNICTILVQYLYVYNCTSIVQLLYIYCTTTGVGTSRRRWRQGQEQIIKNQKIEKNFCQYYFLC